MADAQQLLDSYDNASKPLGGQTDSASLQGQASAQPSPAPALPQPSSTIPSLPEVTPVQNIAPSNPMISNFESAQGANFGREHPVQAMNIPRYEVTTAAPLPEAKEQPSLWDKMIAPVGSFAQGLGGGALHDLDTGEAALEAPFRLAAQKGNIPQEPAPGFEEDYEQQLGKEATENPAYQTGKAIGSLGGYIAQGFAMPESIPFAGRLGAVAAEGGYLSGAESAKEQEKAGKIDAGKLATDVVAGGAISAALGGAGMGLKTLAKNRAAKEALKDKIASAARPAAENAGESIEAYRAKMKEGLSKEVRRFEHDQLNKLWNHLREQPQRNPIQKAQRAALEKVKARQAERLTEINPVSEPGAQGPFRLTKRGKGYEAIDYATPLKDLQGQLAPKTYKQLKDGVEAIADALSWKKHFENETEAYAKHALSLAKTAAQKAKVLAEEETRLTSTAKETVAKAKSELYTKQQQALKAKTQALHDELVDQLRTAPKKSHKELRAQITQLDEALQRLNTPEEVFNIPAHKHLYGIANRAEIESTEVPRELAPTFGKAYKQFVEATNNLKAASKQYEALSKQFLPAFEDAEKELQAKGDKLARVWVKYNISHPYSRKATTEMAVGTQHVGHITYLHGKFAEELNQIEQAIRANEDNLVKEIAYKVGGVERLTQQSGKQAFETLKKLGALHPSLEKIGLAVALGLPALDNPSQAEDNRTPQEKSRFFGNVSIAMIGTIFAAKYGPVVSRRLVRSTDFFYMRCWANTRDLAGFADKVMGLNPFSNPNECLGKQLVNLQGKIVEALFHAPDDHQYLMHSAFKEVDGKLLSPKGQQYAKELHDMGKTFKGFVSNYAKEFNKVYEAKTPDEQAYLKPVSDAVHFINNAINTHQANNLADTHLAKLFVNASKAWFTANPSQFIANFFDVAIGGPLKIGPVATAQGYKSYLTDPILRGMANKLVISGPRSQAMEQAVTKAKPLLVENLQARIMSLGSMKHYFDIHPREMKALGISKWEDFARKLMAGELNPDTTTNAFVQLSTDLVDTLGHDPLNLTKGPISRLPVLGYVMKYISQPERFARLFINNVMQGNVKGFTNIMASLFVIQQLAGHATIPKHLTIAGWVMQPEDQAKLQAFLDTTSIGQHLFGDLSRKVDWDPFLYPFMGVEAPGLEEVLKIVGDLPKIRSQLGQVEEAIIDNPRLFMESKYNPEADKVQTNLRTLINDLSLAYPTLGPIPLQAISAAAYYLPDIKSGSTKVSVPSAYGIGEAAPVEPAQVKTFPGAREAAIRGALRLGVPLDETLYRAARTGVKLGKQDAGLQKIQAQSKIY